MQILQIIDNAYRATVEEQDDTVLWITQVLRNSGASTSILLRGSAVNYAVAKQSAAGVVLGDWRQTQPPDIAAAVRKLVASGVAVYVDGDALGERGIGEADCLAGIRALPGERLGELVDGFDRVWQW